MTPEPPLPGAAAPQQLPTLLPDLRPPGESGWSHVTGSAGCAAYTRVRMRDWVRLAAMATPAGRGSFKRQLREVLHDLAAALEQSPTRLQVTLQTVFLRDPDDRAICQRMIESHFGKRRPVTTYVLQAPGDGAALAMEAWAIGGEGVTVERFGRRTLAVEYDGVRRVYCGDIEVESHANGVYGQANAALQQLRQELAGAGAGMEDVVRTWFYLGGITDAEGGAQRYQELNRARADFYGSIPFAGAFRNGTGAGSVFPASTGIGAAGRGLTVGCVAVQKRRPDATLQPLENPVQTPAYDYSARYSSHSPRFSRAIALNASGHLTTWVSGTASIVASESRHEGDIARQTEQTLDNIQQLIARRNCRRHHLDAGAALADLAKVRVYVKRPEDYARCRAVCDRRLPGVPAVYVIADICRDELLVEIEGMVLAGSKRAVSLDTEQGFPSHGAA